MKHSPDSKDQHQCCAAVGTAVSSWAQLLALRYAVRKENWRPNVLAINEIRLHQLLNDDKFAKSFYLPSSQTDIEQGSIGTVLGLKVQPCNEITRPDTISMFAFS